MEAVASKTVVPILNEDGSVTYALSRVIRSINRRWWTYEQEEMIKRLGRRGTFEWLRFKYAMEYSGIILSKLLPRINEAIQNRCVQRAMKEAEPMERYIVTAARAAAYYLVWKGIDPSPIRYIVSELGFTRGIAAKIGKIVSEVKARSGKRLINTTMKKVAEVFGFKWYIIAKMVLQGKKSATVLAITEILKTMYEKGELPLLKDIRRKYGLSSSLNLRNIEKVLRRLGVPYTRYKYSIVVDHEEFRRAIDRAFELFVKNI